VHLAMPNAKLGAKVDRYSFFVRLLPPLLHTGLARRTNNSIPSIFGRRFNFQILLLILLPLLPEQVLETS
jgi:hypothetical protein